MKKELLEIIKANIKPNKEPRAILFKELILLSGLNRTNLAMALNDLYIDNKITVKDSVNDKLIYLK